MNCNDDTVPIELMNNVDPLDKYLMEEHTARTFANKFWFPKFFVRIIYDRWEKDGGKNIKKILKEKAKTIFENHSLGPMSEKIACEIKKIVSEHKPDVN